MTTNMSVRYNGAADSAYLDLSKATNQISEIQKRMSSGKRVNRANDDVSAWITINSLKSRNGSLTASLLATTDAKNVTGMSQDALSSVSSLLTKINEAAQKASSGALGAEEKVALAKSAYQLSKQIQTVVDSTVYGGKQLLDGAFKGTWGIGRKVDDTIITMDVDLQKDNADYGLANDFDLSSTSTDFAGVTGLDLSELDNVTTSSLGMFSSANITATIQNITSAIKNVSNVSSYVGGLHNRLTSQSELLTNQITNYKTAISSLEDSNQVEDQMELVKQQFLQQTSLSSLAAANTTPQLYLQLLRS